MSYGIAREVPLFVLRAADLQLTTDQPFTKVGNFTNYIPTKIAGVRATGGATVACAGGIYTAAAKGGTAIVAAAQSWLAVTGTLGLTDATIAALTVAYTATPILSLTTGSTAAVTANVFIYGIALD
jgi:hypothetical protein